MKLPFSMPRLMLSIHACLPSGNQSADIAQELAETVFSQLISHGDARLTPRLIAKMAYSCVGRYDADCGLRYGVNHGIITPSSLTT